MAMGRNRMATTIVVALAGLSVIGAGGLGVGLAHAAVPAPAATRLGSSDYMYACITPGGKVRTGSVRLNVAPPTCPDATDTLRYWHPAGGSVIEYGRAEFTGHLDPGRYSQWTVVRCPEGSHAVSGSVDAT